MTITSIHRRRRHGGSEQGFTLIELLVVIFIIGVLSTIALPAFLDQRLKGQDAAAKSDARNLVSAIEGCYQELGGYTGCEAWLATGTGLTIGSGPGEVEITSATETGYTIVATSRASTGGVNHWFSLARDPASADVMRDCGERDRGGCPADGAW